MKKAIYLILLTLTYAVIFFIFKSITSFEYTVIFLLSFILAYTLIYLKKNNE